MGLLVVKILDAVLDPAQELVGPSQRIGRLLRHQAGGGHPLQCLQRRPGPQLGELAAPDHLQQLHDELDLADAAARQLDVVGPLRPSGTAPGRVFANLFVQHPQRIEYAVIEVAPEDEGQHRAAQCGRGAVLNCRQRRHHPALEPGETFPFAALNLEVLFQRAERHHRRAGVAVGP